MSEENYWPKSKKIIGPKLTEENCEMECKIIVKSVNVLECAIVQFYYD